MLRVREAIVREYSLVIRQLDSENNLGQQDIKVSVFARRTGFLFIWTISHTCYPDTILERKNSYPLSIAEIKNLKAESLDLYA